MRVDTALDLVQQVHGVPDGCADRVAVLDALSGVRRLRSWLDAAEVRLAGMLEPISPEPEADAARAAKSSKSRAKRPFDRKRAADQAPTLADALDDGEISGEHLDALAKALAAVPAHLRAALARCAEALEPLARTSTPEQFADALRREAARLEAADGIDRLERQRRAARLRSWIDRASGMFRLSAELDPETGLYLSARIQATIDALFSQQTPPTCPDDPFEKQQHLAALALVALIKGEAPAAGRPEVVVVVEAGAVEPGASQPPHPVTVDWGLPVELPHRVLADLMGVADVEVVVVRNGVVLHAPGVLDLGRTTRVATRAQRRALRAMYRGCAIPGCDARFDHCKIHHVHWWRHGGSTDLHNLLPLCVRHHTAVHHDGWLVELDAERRLTVILPDGTVRCAGPPGRHAA
jgi:hypothetical protein